MKLDSRVKSKINSAPNREFWIDEHALRKVDESLHIELKEVLERLRKGKFKRVSLNDSKQGNLSEYQSYTVVLPKSSNYSYEVVLYFTSGKPLVKTVYRLENSLQDSL